MGHVSIFEGFVYREGRDSRFTFYSSPPESLQFLYLFGRLEMLPSWIPKLHNLVSLGLYGSRLTTSARQALQELPNLKELFFWEFGYGEQLYFYAEGFEKLKLLDFAHSKGLKSVIIEEGSLAVLEDLSIQCCPQLKEVPFGIHNLRELKYVCSSQMSTDFFDRIQPDKGQDYWAVEHIPKVDVLLDVQDRYTPQECHNMTERQRIAELNNVPNMPTTIQSWTRKATLGMEWRDC